MFIDCWKRHHTKPAVLIRRWTFAFLLIAVALSISGAFGVLDWATRVAPPWVLYVFIWLVPLSRCNEIGFAFYRDPMQGLSPNNSFTKLSREQRIGLAVRSYIELIIDFAIIYYLLPRHWFENQFKSIFDAVYFSGVTVTTLGYGDIAPRHIASELLCVYEVLLGFVVIILGISWYLTQVKDPAA
jgi:voltage-gated potassium channel